MEYCGKKLRHELKYYINYYQYICLKNNIKHVMKQDENADDDGNYSVRSLYFDDIYDTALYEKNYGVFHRKKYRIRIYNNSDEVIKLECKSKFGQYINKEAKNLTIDEYDAILNNDFSFLTNKTGIMQDFYRGVTDKLLKPKVIVDYQREAYILESGDVRVTFDKGLKAGFNSVDIFDKNLATISIFDDSMVVLEIKYNEYIPQHILNLINLPSHSRVASSKYVMCRVMKNNIY